MIVTLFAVLMSIVLTSCSLVESKVALIDEAAFERVVDGRQISLYTLRAGNVTMQVTNYGARVVTLWTPDRYGRMADIAIGYDNIDRYINNSGERFLGAAVGPVANRIADGRFVLDGTEYNLPQNNNGQTLHGGELGLDRVVWSVKEYDQTHILFATTLPDGQDGFGGNRSIEMLYRLTEDNCFEVEYWATTDKATVMNMSHHSFFNLAGEGCGTILDNHLTINSSAILAIDGNMIPTGEVMSVIGTPFDFREPHTIGSRIDDVGCDQLRLGYGYDHCWIIDREDNGEVILFARLYEPDSGRVMEVWSDQAAMQFYAGNFFDGSYAGKYERPILYRGAVVFESQGYPDAPNHPDFPSVRLDVGETYRHKCIYKFMTQD